MCLVTLPFIQEDHQGFLLIENLNFFKMFQNHWMEWNKFSFKKSFGDPLPKLCIWTLYTFQDGYYIITVEQMLSYLCKANAEPLNLVHFPAIVESGWICHIYISWGTIMNNFNYFGLNWTIGFREEEYFGQYRPKFT